MANHKSSLKRAKQDKKRRMVNKVKVSAARTAVKAVREAIAKGDKTGVVELLRLAQSKLMKVAKTPAFSQKAAGRRISRLTKQASRLA